MSKNTDILFFLKTLKDELKKTYKSFNDRRMLKESDLVLFESDNDAHFVYENEDEGVKREFILKCNPIQREIISAIKEDAFDENTGAFEGLNNICSAFGKPSNLVLEKVYISHKDGKLHYGYSDPNFVGI